MPDFSTSFAQSPQIPIFNFPETPPLKKLSILNELTNSLEPITIIPEEEKILKKLTKLLNTEQIKVIASQATKSPQFAKFNEPLQPNKIKALETAIKDRENKLLEVSR